MRLSLQELKSCKDRNETSSLSEDAQQNSRSATWRTPSCQTRRTCRRRLTHRELARRSAIRADGKPKRATASLLDISLDGVRDPRLVRKDGRLRVVASVDGNGIRPERRYQRTSRDAPQSKEPRPAAARAGDSWVSSFGHCHHIRAEAQQTHPSASRRKRQRSSIAAVQSSATTIAVCSTKHHYVHRGGRPAKSGPSGSGGLGRRSVLVTS